jgi:hypothetical protein
MCRNAQRSTEMSTVRSALLCLATLAAIAFLGLGIYSVDAGDHPPVDGYGVTASR